MVHWTKMSIKVALICFLSCQGLAQSVDLLAEANATVNVQEDIAIGSFIHTVDILVEGEITLEENDALEIDGSGRVFTVALLDCETQSSYELVVSVFSPELNVSEDGVLNVNVRDVNDNSPVFVRNIYFVAYTTRRETVSEPDRVVVQVRATDADCTFANRQITYSIPDDAFDFTINETSGELFAPVNVTPGLFPFEVFATDSGGLNGTTLAFISFIADCGPVPTITNGVVINVSNTSLLGASANVTCAAGFYTNTPEIVCTSDATWEEAICSPECPVLADPQNGLVDLWDFDNTFGYTAVFYCDAGFDLIGRANLTCLSDGTWDSDPPECTIKDCGPLDDSRVRRQVQNDGQLIIINDNTTYGSIATFTCNPGYTLSSNITLYCTADGSWNGTEPTCNINDCGEVMSPINGETILNNNETTYGSIATFNCDPGYTLSTNTSLECNADGQWNGTEPTCVINDCGEVMSPVNGETILTNNETKFGSIATFNCDPGYTLSSNVSLECDADGQWNGTEPTCIINDCGEVMSPANGETILTNNETTFGSIAAFKCDPGYTLSSYISLECREEGQWNGTEPTCIIKDCGPLESPQRGSVSTSGGILVNATATYSCNNDFRLIGDTTRTCQPSGRWSGSEPSCVRAVVPVTPCPVTTDSRGTQWSQSLPSQIREAECPQGFTGNATRQCNSEGNWNPPIYNCLREKVRNIKQKAASLNNASTAAEVNQVLVELLNVTDETTGDSVQATYQLTDGELTSLSVSFEDVADVISEDQVEDVADTFMTTASNLIDDTNRDTWINVGESKGVGAERVISAVDTVTEKITGKIQATGVGSVVISKKNIAVEVRRIDDEDISFPYTLQNDDIWQNTSTSASIPKAAFQGGNVTSTGVIFRNMSAITRGNKNSGGSGADINGPVVAMTVKPAPQVLDPPLRVIFQHTLTGLKNPSCNFWNITESRWSTSGCVLVSSNDTVSVCECDHLTNFAVLMSAFVEADSESTALRIASIVGIGISMICLILTLAVHFCLRRYLRNDRTTILMHLCVALLASYIVFLAGVDRTESRVFCAIVAVLLQYIYLVVFCVMLAEGIEIGITVLFVFVKRSRIKPLLIGAWVIPAIIVAISLGVTKAEGYGNENFCWLSIESGLIWAFIGPALAIILFNFVILLIVLKVMFSTKAMEQKKKLKKVKTGLRSLGVLIPLMGVTWIIGIFYINEDFYWIQYVFSILNGLQGFFIFLFHCVLNPQIKNARTAQQRRKSSTSLKSTMRTTYKSGSKSDNENSGNEHSNAYLAKSISEETSNMMDNPYKLGRGSGGMFDKRSPKITLPN